jgi:hypothetical protein
LGLLRTGVIFDEVCFLDEGDELLSVSECEGQKSKEVDEIFVCEYTVVNSLKILVQFNSPDKIFPVMMILELLDHFLNTHFFLVVGIQQCKRPANHILLLWLKLAFQRIYQLSVVDFIGSCGCKLTNDQVQSAVRQKAEFLFELLLVNFVRMRDIG